MAKLTIQAHLAYKVAEWITQGRGVAIWQSADLSNLGGEWLTPITQKNGEAHSKPTWQANDSPAFLVHSLGEIDVITASEVKRFHVAVRQSSNGMSLRVTCGGSRKIEAAVAKAAEKSGKNAWHEFDYGDWNNAVILVEGEKLPLTEYLPSEF